MTAKRKSQPQKGQGENHGQTQSLRSSSTACDRSQRQKAPLLLRRCGEWLRLSSHPKLGFSVIPEDIDADNQALWQHICGVRCRPPQAVMLQSLWGLHLSLLQGLLLWPLLAPPHPPACQSPLQGVPTPQHSHPQACLSSQLPTQRSPQRTPTHPPTMVSQGLPLILEVWNWKLLPHPIPQPLLQASQPWATTHRPTWGHRLHQASLYCLGPSVTATQHCVGSMGQDSSKHTWQGTLIPTTERNPQKLPVLGGTTASTSSPILGGATVHGPTLPVDGSTPTAVRQSLVGHVPGLHSQFPCLCCVHRKD